MPTLRQYNFSSTKSGYYIRANVGASHPITLQVSSLAKRIFQQVDYQPGDSVPTKVVWAMYDLDLLYTQSSLELDEVDVDLGTLEEELELQNYLSEAERRELVEYLNQYEGPNKDIFEQLSDKLAGATRNSVVDLGASEDLPSTVDDAVSELYLTTSGVEEFRKAKNRVDKRFLLWSMNSFYGHPYVERPETEIKQDGSIRYLIDLPNREREIWIRDCRQVRTSHDGTPDYVIQVNGKEGLLEATVEDGDLVQISNKDGVGEYSVPELTEDLERILPSGGGITEYAGHKLEPIRSVPEKLRSEVQVEEIQRISNQGNPVIEPDGEAQIVDMGKPGERYLVVETGDSRWIAVARVVS